MYISASRHLACTQFIGARREDTDYLYGFTVSIPLPSYCSWLMHQAPRWFLTLSLYAMFVIEVVLPFGFLAPGWLRPASGASAIFLMCIIHFTGNWGHFNLLTAVVAVSTFDLQAPCTPSLAPLYVGRAGVRGGCAGCVREKGRCACCSARELYPPPGTAHCLLLLLLLLLLTLTWGTSLWTHSTPVHAFFLPPPLPQTSQAVW